jgi:hypothetical protein
VIGVHRDRRDEHVVLGGGSHGLQHRADVIWIHCGHVDDHVEAPPRELRGVAATVPVDGLEPREEPGVAASPVEECHVVAVAQGGVDQGPAEEAGAADDQDLHHVSSWHAQLG